MVRIIARNELKTIAEIHAECFPNSFSTKLDYKGKLLEKLYYEYFTVNPELFLVIENDEKMIIGFCMGYYCEKNDYIKKYCLHNIALISIRMMWLLIKFEPTAWHKLLSVFKKNKTEILDEEITNPIAEMGDILSICILPEYRGKGFSGMLIEEYERVLIKNNKKVCILTVENNNDRAIAFYKKHGFREYKKVGSLKTVYAKEL